MKNVRAATLTSSSLNAFVVKNEQSDRGHGLSQQDLHTLCHPHSNRKLKGTKKRWKKESINENQKHTTEQRTTKGIKEQRRQAAFEKASETYQDIWRVESIDSDQGSDPNIPPHSQRPLQPTGSDHFSLTSNTDLGSRVTGRRGEGCEGLSSAAHSLNYY